MPTLDVLRDEYPGDDAWYKYAAVFRPSTIDADGKAVVQMVPQDESLAEALIGLFGPKEAAHWLRKPNDVLDGRSPNDVIMTFHDGYRIVRHAIMRIPI